MPDPRAAAVRSAMHAAVRAAAMNQTAAHHGDRDELAERRRRDAARHAARAYRAASVVCRLFDA